MTWEEFKEKAEKAGLTDGTDISYIDWYGDDELNVRITKDKTSACIE